jgi:hypothetical protein
MCCCEHAKIIKYNHFYQISICQRSAVDAIARWCSLHSLESSSRSVRSVVLLDGIWCGGDFRERESNKRVKATPRGAKTQPTLRKREKGSPSKYTTRGREQKLHMPKAVEHSSF